MPANFKWISSTPIELLDVFEARRIFFSELEEVHVPGMLLYVDKSSGKECILYNDDIGMIPDPEDSDPDEDYEILNQFMANVFSEFDWRTKVIENEFSATEDDFIKIVEKAIAVGTMEDPIKAVGELRSKWKLNFSGSSDDGDRFYKWDEDLLSQIAPMENYCVINVSTPNNDGYPAYFHVYLKDNSGPVMVYEFDIDSLTDADYSANLKLILSLFENIREPGVYLSEYLASGRVNQLDLFMKDFSGLGLDYCDGFSFKPMRGKFLIYKDNAGEFRFRLRAGDGQIILTSESYKTKARCITGIESVRKNSQTDDCFERKGTESGKWMFNLKASNGRVIGTSESYESEKARESGIASVINNAPEAKLDYQVTYD